MMSLSDIKFHYQDKINNINLRIEKYEDIIEKYTIRIEKAEKEEETNLSSIVKSKQQYEQKIKNLLIIKKYCQEFVENADYLLQNLNGNEVVLSNLKHEELEEANENLYKEICELEEKIRERDTKIKMINAKNEVNKDRIKKQKLQIKELKENKNIKLLKKENQLQRIQC